MAARKNGHDVDGTEPVRAPEVEKLPSGKRIKDYLKDIRECASHADKIKDRKTDLTAKLTAKYGGIEPKMLGWVVQADSWTPERLHDRLACLIYMLEESGLNARAMTAQRLPMGDEAGDAAEAAE